MRIYAILLKKAKGEKGPPHLNMYVLGILYTLYLHLNTILWVLVEQTYIALDLFIYLFIALDLLHKF